MDSSRYFVIKVVAPSPPGQANVQARIAFLGLGFADRSPAFDFQVALQDFANHQSAGQPLPHPSLQTTSLHGSPQAVPAKQVSIAGPTADYALKDGQTIHIRLGNQKQGPNVAGSPQLQPQQSRGSRREPVPQDLLSMESNTSASARTGQSTELPRQDLATFAAMLGPPPSRRTT